MYEDKLRGLQPQWKVGFFFSEIDCKRELRIAKLTPTGYIQLFAVTFCTLHYRMDDPEAIYKFPNHFGSEYHGGIVDGM